MMDDNTDNTIGSESNDYSVRAITESDVLNGKDSHMILESNRLKSFIHWPFKHGLCRKKPALAILSYHCNVDNEADGVRCFCCFKELDGWQFNDDPWIEHQNHQNDCFFIQLSKPESKITVKEFIEVIQHRDLNLLKKQYECMKSQAKQKLLNLGLKPEEKP